MPFRATSARGGPASGNGGERSNLPHVSVCPGAPRGARSTTRAALLLRLDARTRFHRRLAQFARDPGLGSGLVCTHRAACECAIDAHPSDDMRQHAPVPAGSRFVRCTPTERAAHDLHPVNDGRDAPRPSKRCLRAIRAARRPSAPPHRALLHTAGPRRDAHEALTRPIRVTR
ncbi:hypothetical protein HYPSUDRAFT_205169 [Hypholoma sublateritium FD-334 SS-4]|uniref:Uncharacterized protein n=1 Tax=Hypholoma sublateritium (strain FD-334 SS-4) TaxID=945553 RepID=A0A0D2NI87_HYPSF|nr:hypothetical protein HYPSUDRAFT_205169 [Hypholoma sublateritium FD-334 SS-4]